MIITSLVKSIQIIEILSKNRNGMSITEISNILGFPKSTIHHILNTLLVNGYISSDKNTKKYSLGLKFLTLSRSILDAIDISKIAHEDLRKLHEEAKDTVHLAVLQNGQVYYIDKIEKPGSLSLSTYIGFSTDPHAAAGGKVLLSEIPRSEVIEIYKNKPLKAYSKKTITNVYDLFDELENVRQKGYAIDDEEYYEGVRCIAAPIRWGGKIVAAVSLTGSIFTMTKERINDELLELLLHTTKRISSELSW